MSIEIGVIVFGVVMFWIGFGIASYINRDAI